MKLKDLYIQYITDYSFGKPRLKPANPKTIGRQRRGLNLVEKLIGHSLDDVTNEDQLIYMEKIRSYAQGTRIVSTTMFQRFLWWGIDQGHLDCQNLIKGNEAEIIGNKTPVRYASMTQREVDLFFTRLTLHKHKLILLIVYLTGADSSDIIDMGTEDVKETFILLRRMKLGTTQTIQLPAWLMKDLNQYAKERGRGRLFFEEIEDKTEQRDSELDSIWKQACIQTKMFQNTSFRDFRVNAIKHFHFNTPDEESVKAFAGVPAYKQGWLADLVTDQELFLKDRLEERFNHG